MSEMPKRIQRKRTKGWRMPDGAINVCRPSRWGNPFTVAMAVEAGFLNSPRETLANLFVVDCFRDWLEGERSTSGRDWWHGPESDRRKAAILGSLDELRGRSLACWCPLDQPCHADVLLELANKELCERCNGTGWFTAYLREPVCNARTGQHIGYVDMPQGISQCPDCIGGTASCCEVHSPDPETSDE